jgi:hypothetical protein
MTDRAVLLFDSESELCRTSVRWVVRHDRRKQIAPVPIQSPDGERLLAAVPASRRGLSWHLVLDDHVYSGGDVLNPLAELLDRPLAARFLKRAIGGMGRVSQSRPSAAEAGSRGPAAPETPVGGNGAPEHETRADPGSAAPALAGNGGPAPEGPSAGHDEPAPVADGPAPIPDEEPVADSQPAVGLIDRPAPVRVPTPEPAEPRERPAAVAERAASPADGEPGEAADWQSRIERSPFGRGVLSVLILITLIAIVATNLPNSDLRTIAMRPGQPYLNALGLDQAWGVFAPDPRRAVIDVSAFVTYDDRKVAQWSIPRNGALLGSYTDYRWGKWEEFLIQPGVGSSLWQPAAEWAASREVRPGHTIKRVVLVERYRQLAPPGVTPSIGATKQKVFYSLSLPGTGRRGQSQAPLPPGGGGL